jgi:Kef-type K+ transport system membrane component KefB
MLKDIIILFLFVIGLSAARTMIGGNSFEVSKLVSIFFEIAGSIGCGIIIGVIIVFYLKIIRKRNGIIFIMMINFFSYEIFEPLHLHPLLIMMIAGFIVQNFSNRGEKLIKALEAISPTVYPLFFCLIGAKINISYLKSFFVLTLVIVFFRILFKYAGTYVGGAITGEDSLVKNRAWMAFISQAGVSLGMAKIIEKNLNLLGSKIFTLIVSVIVINEIIGPLLLKFFVDKSTVGLKVPESEAAGTKVSKVSKLNESKKKGAVQVNLQKI